MTPCTCGHSPEEHPNLRDEEAQGPCEACDCAHYEADEEDDDA